jgi:hypothetical protein
MPAGQTPRSWWVGLSRTELHEAIRAREAGWRAQSPKYLDHLGAQIGGGHEPSTGRSRSQNETAGDGAAVKARAL